MGTKRDGDLPFYSDTFESEHVYIQAWYPVRGVLGAMAPEGYEPPTLFKVQISKVNSDKHWRVYSFTREDPAGPWSAVVKDKKRFKRGAVKEAMRLMKEHVDG